MESHIKEAQRKESAVNKVAKIEDKNLPIIESISTQKEEKDNKNQVISHKRERDDKSKCKSNMQSTNYIRMSQEPTSTEASPFSKGSLGKTYRSYQSMKELDEKYNDSSSLLENTALVSSLKKNYLEDNPEMDKFKRLILLDWLMEVCACGFKRNTFHLSCVIFDVFLSKIKNFQMPRLQLIGVTSLIIASKNEEIIIPSIEWFVKATDNQYTIKDVILWEQQILEKLNWHVQFPSWSTLGNYTMDKWDSYASKINEENSSKQKYIFPLFRKNDSVGLINKFFSIADAIAWDYSSIFLSEKIMCSCIIYLWIGLELQCFEYENILNLFHSGEFKQNFYYFNAHYDEFNKKYLDIEQVHFFDTLKYVCNFFIIQQSEVNPQRKGRTFEETIQIQTYNNHNINNIRALFQWRDEMK